MVVRQGVGVGVKLRGAQQIAAQWGKGRFGKRILVGGWAQVCDERPETAHERCAGVLRNYKLLCVTGS